MAVGDVLGRVALHRDLADLLAAGLADHDVSQGRGLPFVSPLAAVESIVGAGLHDPPTVRPPARDDHWPEVQFREKILCVEVIAAATIWALFGSFLIFPMFQLPSLLPSTAGALLVAEFLAVMMNGLGGPAVATAGRSLAMVDIPLLTAGLVGAAIMHGWSSRGAFEGSRHGLARQGGRRFSDRAR